MLYETLTLWEKHPEATLTTYVCDNPPQLKMPPRPAMIVCSGGGYHDLAARESETIVRTFLGAGMNVYLLRYSVEENARDYAPLIEAAMAIRYVRENAVAHNTDPHRVFICGFSAGGHLAASSGILWNIPEVRDALEISTGKYPEGINRPDGMILAYAVITSGKYTHKGTFCKLCGSKEPTEEEMKRFSLELHVDETSTPAFIWHTVTDICVPVQNSLLLVNALLEHGVSLEAHIFPEGVHGLALANKETWTGQEHLNMPHVQCWVDLAIRWTQDQF